MRPAAVDNWSLFSPYFKRAEFACKCGCGTEQMQLDFMHKLYRIRLEFDRAMVISSGYRCSSWNQRVSTTGPFGPHVTGRACDVLVFGEQALQLVEVARRAGMTGFGLAQKGPRGGRFVHLDDLRDGMSGPRPWVWSY